MIRSMKTQTIWTVFWPQSYLRTEIVRTPRQHTWTTIDRKTGEKRVRRFPRSDSDDQLAEDFNYAMSLPGSTPL